MDKRCIIEKKLQFGHKKEPQPTPIRASTEALSVWMRLKLCCEIDLYPDIFVFRGMDRKIYGVIFLRRLQSEKTLIFHPFHDTSNALSVYSGALGGVTRTTDYNSTKALLAVMHTPAADIVVLASPVCIKEECPFEFPLLAPAHRSCSGFRSLWGLSL